MKRIRPGILLLFAISHARASDLAPLPSIGPPARQVVASWYGKIHEGKKTASGTIFRRHELTAAHRTAKFGTRFMVFYKDQAIEVRITDRGPYVKRFGSYSRDLDLSEAAARALGMVEVGVAEVGLRVIDYPPVREVVENRLLPMIPATLASLD